MSDIRPAVSPETLLVRIAEADRAALAALFESEAGRLLAIARRIVRRSDLAEEVVQETFVAVWQRSRQFDPARGSARGWLTTMVRNRALNMLRDGGRLEFHDATTLEALSGREQDAVSAFQMLADSEGLKHCLGQLDEPKRRAVLLTYVVGMSNGEVAERLAVPLGTAKSWIRRSIATLQECMR
ncbi:sigma-70 family RNA polymerase sigma factor [Devosia sp. A16]|uniref:sigma-70 family RNA polymerase sigma factor n=1 Tax=Devosia sp. A16 TaxID=1736675 RepID=UPI001F00E918|nr:sigma-70 family RNA polymerase sigma factor [Devosia sp. A16]